VSKKLRLAAGVLILAAVAWKTDWPQVADAFAHARWHLWLLAVAVYGLTQIVSSLRWQLLSQPLGFRRPLRQHTAFFFIGMFFNLVLPTSVGGDVMRAWYLDGGSGRRMAAFLSVFIDRFSGLVVLVAITCLATLFCPVPLPPWLAGGVALLAAGAVFGTAFLLAVGFAYRRAEVSTHPADEVQGFVAKTIDRVRRFALSLVGAVTIYSRYPKLFAATTLLSLVVQAANVVVVWLVGEALGLAVPAAYYFVLVPLVTLSTLLPVSIGGHGVREAATIVLLAPLGVGSGSAVSLSFLSFITYATISLAGVGFYLFGNYPRYEASDHGTLGRGPDQGREGQSAAAA
jgi:glycosyltransferase 2 family protein